LKAIVKYFQSSPSNATAVKSKLSKVVQKFGIRLDSHCKAIEMIPANVPDLVTTIINLTSTLATEQRERHQLNVILHNVPESKSSDPNTRKKEDIDQHFQMCWGFLLLVLMQSDLVRKKIMIRLLKIVVETLDQILRSKLKLRGKKAQTFTNPSEQTETCAE